MVSTLHGQTHKIVCLDAFLCPVPSFSILYEYHEYDNTPPELVLERVKDATIIIVTRVHLTSEVISQCPNLQFIAVMAIGYNTIDIAACRKYNVAISNCPASSSEAVAEHAFALYFAAKRRIVDMHLMTLKAEEWPAKSSVFGLYPHPPLVARHDTMGIIGYGALGKHIERIAKALSIAVLIADRKGSTTLRPGRTSFVDTLQKSTVLMIGCPLDETSRNMIGEEELKLMQPIASLINVARGGVVNEKALVQALKQGTIANAATDVFENEPATSESPYISEAVPNLTLSPHIAWYADSSLENLQRIVKANVEGFVIGKPENLVTPWWSAMGV
ncbi:Glycerate dehydrogenase [Hyphodiscus hymeniophilus]|uniref:Glycerate dehydrogenase n=1 Tax=Hyphodiscus hymeniophilus TaxID=353542 RepID=A0A9P6VJZ5_9HELO|nr:Glycerate dehydrogenase [Hyphodiscus hymeniophilus]